MHRLTILNIRFFGLVQNRVTLGGEELLASRLKHPAMSIFTAILVRPHIEKSVTLALSTLNQADFFKQCMTVKRGRPKA